ncbi:MAG: alpha/beta fold hydrolase [Gammaproteobacteria bacterium]
MKNQTISVMLGACLMLATAHHTAAEPLIEHYGSLPESASMVVSPDGKHYAFIKRTGDSTRLLVFNTEQRTIVGGAKLPEKTKGHYVRFVTNNYVLFRASQTTHRRTTGTFEFSGAYAYSIKDDKTTLLLARSQDIYSAQGGLGRYVGVNPQTNEVFMPAYSDRKDTPLDLYRVNLDTGRGRRFGSGRYTTLKWFVDSKGKLLARADMDTRRETYSVFAYPNGKSKEIFSVTADRPPIGLLGVDADEKSLLFSEEIDGNRAIFRMALDTGEVTGPVFSRDGLDLDYVELDVNRKLLAVVYGGLKPTYDFVDDRLDDLYEQLSDRFKGSSVFYSTSTSDMNTHLFTVSGSDRANDTVRASGDPVKLTVIGRGYPNLSAGDLGAIEPWVYNARDGLEIPSVLTWPVNVAAEQRKNLPLLVMPHGGPSAHDSLTFDWWSQYFAARGYAILQPNFRGSDGFGTDHERAGFGEWGKKMQDDVTDGVRSLIDAGIADADRVCIMGASYGGYSALAGGAFTPDMYRCIVAFAPVSDIPRMLNDDASRYGRNHWVTRYWADIVGDRKKEKDALKSYSPVNFAEQFTAPVLLLHGRKDTVVPLDQSKVMRKALKRAKKPVELVLLDGEDHWLSSSETRQSLLREIDEFVTRHNPPN